MSTPAWKQCDPQVGSVEDHLLVPPKEEDLSNVLPFGVAHIDQAMVRGVNLKEGELIVIQGSEKNRKTTLVLNMVRVWSKLRHCLQGGKILVETLESSMTRARYKQHLITMEATAYMMARHYGVLDGNMQFPVIFPDKPHIRIANMDQVYKDMESELLLSVDRAMRCLRTPLQQEALEYAVEEVNKWPVLLYGAAPNEGHTRAFNFNGRSINFRDELPYLRWIHAIEEYGVKIIVVDHVQGYPGAGSDYERLGEVSDRFSTLVAENHVVVVAVSQIPLTALRDPTAGIYARGGKRLSEEAYLVLTCEYDQDMPYMTIYPSASRGALPPVTRQNMEMNSGVFIGWSYALDRSSPYKH